MLGPVFRAHDSAGDRLVAVKVFRLDLTPERAQELAAELQKLVALELTHPVIASPIAAGVEGSVAFLAETYVPAESLDVALRQFGPAPFDDVLRLATQLAGAIDFAGAVGAFHGGLHPRDVLVSADEIRLIGFGIIPALERVGVRAPVRRPYTAPERLDGGSWGRQADVFSLAAIVHELLLGRRIAGTTQQVIDNVAEIAGASQDKLRTAFAKGLAPDPADRFPNALSFASALRDAATSAVAGPEGESTLQTRLRAERIPVPPAAAAAAAAAVDQTLVAKKKDADSADTLRRDPATLVSTQKREREKTAAAHDPELTPPTLPSLPFSGPIEDEPTSVTITSQTFPTMPFEYVPEPIDQVPMRDPGGAGKAHADDVVIDATAPTLPALPPSDATIPSLSSSSDLASGAGKTTTPPPAAPLSKAPERRAPLSGAPLAGASLAGAPLTGADDRPQSRRRSSILAAMLIAGMILGALGGYEYARRARQADEASTAATSGRDATDVAVEPAPRETPKTAATATPSASPSAALSSAPASTPAPRPAPSAATARPSPATPPRVAARPPASEKSAPAELGRMLVRSTPAGADVTINGEGRGATPVTVRNLAYGSYTIRVARRGYIPEERRLTLSRNSPSASMTFSLRAVQQDGGEDSAPVNSAGGYIGSLAVDSRPSGAAVFLNGRRVGETPTVLPGLKAGSYALRLEREGYARWSSSVRVVAGQQGRITASLERERDR